MKHHPSLVVVCDVVTGPKDRRVLCGHTETFLNEDGDADYVMERKARQAGWYLPLHGRDRCPAHHREEALRGGYQSLYDEPKERTVPIVRGARGKEGA